MLIFLPLMLLMMLLQPALTMDAASAACRLFVTSVMPGLMPYMVFSLMLVSRLPGRMPPGVLMLLGWCGGSPTGAGLMRLCPGLGRRAQRRLAVSCATMSPMFLLGTIGAWLDAPVSGAVVLGSVIAGGWIAGWAAWLCTRDGPGWPAGDAAQARLSFGQAIDQAARTMLLVCGTMVMLRVLAALLTRALPLIALPVTTLLEVTTGAAAIAQLPLPLSLRTAILAGCTGFGGMAIIMQNRALYPQGMLSLFQQALWQAAHGAASFLLALGAMMLLG